MFKKALNYVLATCNVTIRLVKIIASKHDREILGIKKLISEESEKLRQRSKQLDSLNELFYENRKNLEYLYFGYKDAKQFRTKMKKADEFLKRVNPLVELGVIEDFNQFIQNLKLGLEKEIKQRVNNPRIVKNTEEQRKDIQFIPEKWDLKKLYESAINQS